MAATFALLVGLAAYVSTVGTGDDQQPIPAGPGTTLPEHDVLPWDDPEFGGSQGRWENATGLVVHPWPDDSGRCRMGFVRRDDLLGWLTATTGPPVIVPVFDDPDTLRQVGVDTDAGFIPLEQFETDDFDDRALREAHRARLEFQELRERWLTDLRVATPDAVERAAELGLAEESYLAQQGPLFDEWLVEQGIPSPSWPEQQRSPC